MNTKQAPEAGVSFQTFQSRVKPWMDACFGPEISADKVERNHRFLEEAVELVQANGCTQSEAHQLVHYVYGRPAGEINQEVGGVMVTLAALCLASGTDMHEGGEIELRRIWTMVEKIRAKQAAKPKHSPLPEVAVPPAHPDVEAFRQTLIEEFKRLRSGSSLRDEVYLCGVLAVIEGHGKCEHDIMPESAGAQ